MKQSLEEIIDENKSKLAEISTELSKKEDLIEQLRKSGEER